MLLFGWRVVASVGTGAEGAIIAPFLAEFVEKKVRGRFIGALAGFFSYGFVFAALLGYFVIPASSEGWRIVQVVSAVPIAMRLWWRRSLPESPRWLIERGRSAEAEVEVARMEAEARRRHGSLPSIEGVEVPAVGPRSGGTFAANLAALWSPSMRRTTLMLWILWLAITFSYYGFFTWIPSLLVKQGMTTTRSFGYSIVIYLAQIPGYYSAAFLSEKLDRKWTIVLYMLPGGAAAYLMSSATTETSIMVAGAMLSFFMNGTYAGIYAYTPSCIRRGSARPAWAPRRRSGGSAGCRRRSRPSRVGTEIKRRANCPGLPRLCHRAVVRAAHEEHPRRPGLAPPTRASRSRPVPWS